MKTPETIREYIAEESPEVQKVLKKMWALARKAAPKATEKIAWGMPTLVLEGNLITFAAFKKHLSLFPGSEAMKHFEKELKGFTTSKGTIQFPYEDALPIGLITRVVKFCVRQNLAWAETKRSAKVASGRKKVAAKVAKKASGKTSGKVPAKSSKKS